MFLRIEWLFLLIFFLNILLLVFFTYRFAVLFWTLFFQIILFLWNNVLLLIFIQLLQLSFTIIRIKVTTFALSTRVVWSIGMAAIGGVLLLNFVFMTVQVWPESFERDVWIFFAFFLQLGFIQFRLIIFLVLYSCKFIRLSLYIL